MYKKKQSCKKIFWKNIRQKLFECLTNVKKQIYAQSNMSYNAD